jgi:hypothetical protein
MWYITYDNWNGGLAHNFFDLLTTLIISKIFNIEYIHCDMYLDGRGSAWDVVVKEMENDNNKRWERLMFDTNLRTFFNFKGENKTIENINKENNKCKVINIGKSPSFGFITLEEINNILQRFNRKETLLFRLVNNNRIWLWTFYDLCNRNIIDINLFNEIRNKLKYNFPYKPTLQKNTISIHIRKGDCDDPLELGYNILKNIKKNYKIDKINIYSMGTEKQMNEISNFYTSKNIDNIEYKFNLNTIQTIKEMMSTEILICSCIGYFSKMIGYFTDTIKFYSFFFRDKSNGNFFLEASLANYQPENYEVKDNELYNFSINMIKCDKNGNFNEEQFQKSLNNIKK